MGAIRDKIFEERDAEPRRKVEERVVRGAIDFLRRSAELMHERGKQYDQPDGERSMAKTVEALYIITGKRLTESEGWLFMQLLKDVRQWSRETYHADSAEDCIAYSALKAEALERESMKCSTPSGTTQCDMGA